MNDTKRILVALPLPPLVVGQARNARSRRADTLPRIARLLWLATAFSLPVLGLTFADLVHRAGRQETTQAAVPSVPSAGAAVSFGATRAVRMVRVAPSGPLRREGRA